MILLYYRAPKKIVNKSHSVLGFIFSGRNSLHIYISIYGMHFYSFEIVSNIQIIRISVKVIILFLCQETQQEQGVPLC